ncbi:hypothetical protein ACFQS6_00860 [Xanthomonas populi]|uniref:hypothetical protein n=1 Tax=Xanthomonas populi TaxID=53414 RepID=UPI000FF88C64|nr:hypothetical protein [Xanthomonas populi]
MTGFFFGISVSCAAGAEALDVCWACSIDVIGVDVVRVARGHWKTDLQGRQQPGMPRIGAQLAID